MTAKRRLCLQIVISLSSFFIAILELGSGVEQPLPMGVGAVFWAVAMLFVAIAV